MNQDNIYFQTGYKPAKCCNPEPGNPIRGYYSYNGEMIVHRADCGNLNKVEKSRIVDLRWTDILEAPPQSLGEDYDGLNQVDFRVLEHHSAYGVDYSLKVAGMLKIPKQEIFDCHAKLREMNLLERVEPLIIRYRKGIVDNKWIKHRNHTYYSLTDRGRLYLEYYRSGKK